MQRMTIRTERMQVSEMIEVLKVVLENLENDITYQSTNQLRYKMVETFPDEHLITVLQNKEIK